MQVDARGILFVDDEAPSRKWFARVFGNEFEVSTAASADEAMALLDQRGPDFAAVLTDYRMPGADGMHLLTRIQREHRHLVRLLATAYAEKDVAIAAVNQGRVLRILEKPLEDEATRETLREALEVYRSQALERALHESRAAALRETLGFLAHELNTPLATIQGCLSAVLERRRAGSPPGLVQFDERHVGEVLNALQRAERRAQYCQSLVATFVQSARDAYPGAAPQAVSVSGLLTALVDEYPFEAGERGIVQLDVRSDFRLPGRRDLLYLVLCTLTKNALQALRGQSDAHLRIETGVIAAEGRAPEGWIRFVDNGPGIAPDVLARLTREPVTTKAASGGNGMGLMFCQRVLQDAGGAVSIESTLGAGTAITLRMLRGVAPAGGA